MYYAEVIDHLVRWLKNYAKTNGLKGYVLGISGGIDSALVSTLCAKTGLPTLCVEMPIHQAPSETHRSKIHIDWLTTHFINIERQKVDLSETFDAFVNSLSREEEVKTEVYELALANTRARLRMSLLYYYAGIKGYIVTGTGNKIEDFGIGFYTKYGDGGVDISPIADLTKTEVYGLSEFLGIDDRILKAQPTDGLFGDSRSDEDQIGATYPELEWAMTQYEKGKTPKDFEGRKAEVLEIYARRHQANRHKWEPIPVCLIPEELR